VDEIALCHDRGYIVTAKEDVESGLEDLSTGDTSICPRSYDVAIQAVGGVLNAVDAVFAGKAKNAFCAVRPPGHHARPAQGMGFCLFNNIAIAARHAQKRHGAQKIAIVDWDVHHGNGTQDIFYEDGSVFFASTHQSPLYPFTGHADETGSGKGRGSTLNVPFPARTGMSDIGAAFTDRLLPAIDQFKPDLILISAGFDSRIDDPLGQFRLTDDDFVTLTKLLLESAATHCQNRLISVLEGGYNLKGLASAVTSHVGALL
jgi:acetoin utilization deacetylase AcuC-like enzyme